MHTQAYRHRDADGADQTNAFKKNRFTRKRCSVEISCGYVKNHTKFTSTQTKMFYIDFVISIHEMISFPFGRGSKDNHWSFKLSYLFAYVPLKYLNASNYEQCNSCFAAIEKKICDVLIHQNNHIQLHALESINTRAHNSQMKNLTWILCDGKVFILFCSLCRCMYVRIRAKPEHLLMWLPNQQSGGVSVCVCMVVLCDGYYPLCTVVLYTCDSKFQYGVKCQMHTQHSMTGTLYSDQ